LNFKKTKMVKFKNEGKEIREELSSEWNCKECGSTDIIEDHAAGDMVKTKKFIKFKKVCTNCGFVVGERVVDVEKEWREFESDPDSRNKSRVGGKKKNLFFLRSNESVKVFKN
jgi:transcription initiation factor TFIIIB Brf1 subunit/transcription initiation factor TFIIB